MHTHHSPSSSYSYAMRRAHIFFPYYSSSLVYFFPSPRFDRAFVLYFLLFDVKSFFIYLFLCLFDGVCQLLARTIAATIVNVHSLYILIDENKTHFRVRHALFLAFLSSVLHYYFLLLFFAVRFDSISKLLFA